MALEAVVKLTKEQYEILANGGTVGPYTGIDNTKYLYFVQDDISVGSATNPVYFLNGSPVACTYSLNKTVPADADFGNSYHTTGSWSGLTYTATDVGGADPLAFTIPTGDTSTTVARGDHTHDSRYVRFDINNQNLNDTQKGNARTNIGAGTYSKPGGGIPDGDLATSYLPLSAGPLKALTDTLYVKGSGTLLRDVYTSITTGNSSLPNIYITGNGNSGKVYINSLVIGSPGAPGNSIFSREYGTIGVDRTYTLPDKNGTFAMTSDIPSLSGYATESWVDNNYLGKTAKAADSDSLDGHDSSYFATADHSHSQANLTSWLGLGTLNNSPSWGTVKSANGYTVIWGSDQPNGGGLVFGEKSGQTSMQIDGEIYVNEGSVRLAHVGEAQPASDVYPWAKEATKPSYNFSEIQPGTAVVDYNGGVVFRSETSSWYSGIYYSTPNEEAVIFANKSQGNQDNAYQQQWLFAYTDMQNRTAWTSLGDNVAMQIKGHRVAINKMVGSSTQIPYNLDVNGSANATTVTVAAKMTMQYNSNEDCIDFVFA